MLFIAFTRISTKSVEPIANFKPRGKCIWLIARVVAQNSVYCTILIVPSIRRWRIDFKISELVVGELTKMREVPAKTTRSRKIRIVAGRGFWQICPRHWVTFGKFWLPRKRKRKEFSCSHRCRESIYGKRCGHIRNVEIDAKTLRLYRLGWNT